MIEINILVGTQFGTRPTSCDFHSGLPIAGFITRIAEKVTRIRDIKLVFNTYNIDTYAKNQDSIVFPFLNQEFHLKGFRSIEFNKVIFVNKIQWHNPESEQLFVRTVIHFESLFLDS